MLILFKKNKNAAVPVCVFSYVFPLVDANFLIWSFIQIKKWKWIFFSVNVLKFSRAVLLKIKESLNCLSPPPQSNRWDPPPWLKSLRITRRQLSQKKSSRAKLADYCARLEKMVSSARRLRACVLKSASGIDPFRHGLGHEFEIG